MSREAPFETARERSDALFVVKVGPVDAGPDDGVIDAFVPVLPDGRVDPPQLVASPHDALPAIAVAARARGLRLECAPELAVAGRRHGFAAAEIPRTGYEAMLAFSLMSAVPPNLGELRVSAEDAVSLGRLTRDLWLQAPWAHWRSDSPVEVRLHAPDARTERLAASIMGAGGDVHGFALYDVETFDAITGGTIDSKDVAGISLTLDTFSDAAINAFRAAFDVPCFPMPMQALGGSLVAPTTEQLFKLIAVGRALAQLRPTHLVARGELHFDNGSMFADVTAPEPVRRAAPASRPKPKPVAKSKAKAKAKKPKKKSLLH